MSRMRLYLRSVASGYLVTAANILVSFISVPLALYYLPKREFALWALTYQITGYLLLLDFGMTPSTSRLLIEAKEDKTGGAYGRLVAAAMLVGIVQGGLIIGLGQVLPMVFKFVVDVPGDLHREFMLLLRWQCVITGISFALRILRQVLVAHQRNDLINYSVVASLLTNLATLWVSLRLGAGVYSILWASAAAAIASHVLNALSVVQLGLLPNRLITPNKRQLSELFRYGGDIFLVHLGSQLIMATQSIVLGRTQGLDVVAAWAVGTKAFLLLCTILWQLYDYSIPALSEMIVRQELVKLRTRYAAIVGISMSLAAVAAVGFAACNTPFLRLWTGGLIEWSPLHDALLAAWLLLLVMVHCHCGFVLLTKSVALMRYIYFLEGLGFVVIGTLTARQFGIDGMVAISLIMGLLFSGWYGTWRVWRFLGFRPFELEKAWASSVTKLLLVLVPLAIAVSVATREWDPAWQLIVRFSLLGPAGLFLWSRYGIPASMHTELQKHLPGFLRPIWLRLQPVGIAAGDKAPSTQDAGTMTPRS